MTVRQIIQEIETLSPEERLEVEAFFHKGERGAGEIRYLDRETARPLIKEILTEHTDMFRKLAQ